MELGQFQSGTYLATTVRGTVFYLYLILDIYSRKIVGWEVYSDESAEHAAEVFKRAHLREAVGATDLVLHSDNRSPMKGATMLSTLRHLGVVPSFSRPSVSNDSHYSEAILATCKGCPAFPEKPFASPEEARIWVVGFVAWYNETHRHSTLKFVTPAQSHRGEDRDLLAQRDALYQAASAENPERWSSPTLNWEPPPASCSTQASPDHDRTRPRSLRHDSGGDPRPDNLGTADPGPFCYRTFYYRPGTPDAQRMGRSKHRRRPPPTTGVPTSNDHPLAEFLDPGAAWPKRQLP